MQHGGELGEMDPSKYLSFFIPVNHFQSHQSLHTLTHKHTHTHARHRHCCVTVLTQVGGLKSAPHRSEPNYRSVAQRPLCCNYTFILSSRRLTCIREFCASIGLKVRHFTHTHTHFLYQENALELHRQKNKNKEFLRFNKGKTFFIANQTWSHKSETILQFTVHLT